MAVSMWGSDAYAVRTNRKGAFYYNCSGHGGYVVDGRSLSEAERTAIDRFIQPEFATEIVRTATGIQCQFRGPTSRRSLHYNSHSQHAVEVPIYFFEEDCDWCILEKFTDIRIKSDCPSDPELAFWNWFDINNPKVAERHRRDSARASHSPDLIICATPTHVGTADGLQHPKPENYTPSNPWLGAYS